MVPTESAARTPRRASSAFCLALQEGQSRFAPHLQQHLWPGSTTADTRLAHSSASDDFRTSRRHLLGNTQTSAQAEKGVGVISYRPVGFNIDGDDFALFFLRAHANNRSTGKQASCKMLVIEYVKCPTQPTVMHLIRAANLTHVLQSICQLPDREISLLASLHALAS